MAEEDALELPLIEDFILTVVAGDVVDEGLMSVSIQEGCKFRN